MNQPIRVSTRITERSILSPLVGRTEEALEFAKAPPQEGQVDFLVIDEQREKVVAPGTALRYRNLAFLVALTDALSLVAAIILTWVVRSPSASGFRNVAGHGAAAVVDGRRVVLGNRRLMTDDNVDLGSLAARRDELAAKGRTAVFVAVDGRAAGVIAMADAPRDTAAAAVAALHDTGVRVVMLTGDNEATARRIAA